MKKVFSLEKYVDYMGQFLRPDEILIPEWARKRDNKEVVMKKYNDNRCNNGISLNNKKNFIFRQNRRDITGQLIYVNPMWIKEI